MLEVFSAEVKLPALLNSLRLRNPKPVLSGEGKMGIPTGYTTGTLKLRFEEPKFKSYLTGPAL